jgi:hypothetical protein
MQLLKEARRAFRDAGEYGLTDIELADLLGMEGGRAIRVRRLLRQDGYVVISWAYPSRPDWPPPRPSVWMARRSG